MQNDTEFQLESDIPIPAYNDRYPFAAMAVGKSFLAEGPDARRARAAATKYGQYHNQKFTSRTITKEPLAVRIWRTE